MVTSSNEYEICDVSRKESLSDIEEDKTLRQQPDQIRVPVNYYSYYLYVFPTPYTALHAERASGDLPPANNTTYNEAQSV